jgi:hypothetical protein
MAVDTPGVGRRDAAARPCGNRGVATGRTRAVRQRDLVEAQNDEKDEKASSWIVTVAMLVATLAEVVADER